MEWSRKIFCFVLLTGMILGSFQYTTNVMAMDYTEETLNSVEVFGTTGVALSDTILFVDYGTTEGKVVFDDFINGGDGAGPEAFWVENESSIFILDSVAKRINHYINGEFADSLMLMSTIAPRCFCMADNGTVYVCDTYNGESKLFIYQENKLKNVFSIGKIDVRSINIDKNGQIQVSDWYDEYIFYIQDSNLQCTAKNELKASNMNGSAYARQVGKDENVRYEIQTQLVDCSMLLGEIRLVAVDYNDNIVAGVRIPLEEFVYRPNQYFQVDKNGNVFLMIPNVTGLEIRKVVLGKESDSEINKIVTFAKNFEAEIQRTSTYSSSVSLSLTRHDVLEKANYIAMHGWTLSSKNISTNTDVKLPDFIQRAVSDGLLENGGTVRMSGIPYCWGGFDSQYTSNNSGYSTFADAISAGYTAGNICSDNSGKVGKTAGLDCSGFVSAAYGFSAKKGTGYFADYGTEVDIDTIETMDFLIRYKYTGKSNHVLLFYNWNTKDKSRMLIIEASNPEDYDDKTLIRVVDTDDYLNNGYIMRTPW